MCHYVARAIYFDCEWQIVILPYYPFPQNGVMVRVAIILLRLLIRNPIGLAVTLLTVDIDSLLQRARSLNGLPREGEDGNEYAEYQYEAD